MSSFRIPCRAIAVGAALVAVLPASASASRVTITHANVNGTDAPTLFVDGTSGAAPGTSLGQTNRIFIDDDPSCQQAPLSCNTVTVRDLGASIRAEGPHCRQLTANAASCTGAQIGDTRQYSVLLGEANDSLTVNSRYLTFGGAVQGGAGDDAFSMPVRARDLIIGGSGRDTLSYLSRTSGGAARVDALNDGQFNDGQSGEDRVIPDVEQVTGTNFDDVLFVPNQSQNTGRVPHGLLSGANGNDTLFGSPFADTLNGGAGFDALHGGSGGDLLEARENSAAGQAVARDELRCGPGIDTGVMDLQDVQFDCENLSIAAIDEGGILAIATRVGVVRRGRARIALHCPADSKTPCRGRLTLRRAGEVLGAASYRVAKGRRARVAVRAGRARGIARATAVERDSQGRPKTTVARLRLR